MYLFFFHVFGSQAEPWSLIYIKWGLVGVKIVSIMQNFSKLWMFTEVKKKDKK